MALSKWLNNGRELALRPYQREALLIFLKRKKGIIAHPTALGKTFIAIEAIRRLNTRTAVFVPTKAILNQVWRRRLSEYGIPHGVFYGDEKNIQPVTIFLYQSAIRHPEVLEKLNPRLVIFDEVHHLKAERWQSLLRYATTAEYALGLTATISTRDPNARRVLSILPLIHTMRYSDAKGYVAPAEIHIYPAPLSRVERAEYEYLQSIIRKTALRLGTTDLTVWSRLAGEGNEEAKKGLYALAQRRKLLSGVRSKREILLNIVKENRNSKILLFSESIASIEALKNLLQNNGIGCVTYHSKKSRSENNMALKLWNANTTPVLLSVTALEEGVDIPDASVGIFYASGYTRRKIVQRIGRLMRKAPGKIARLHIIYASGTVEEKVVTEANLTLGKKLKTLF